MPTVADLAEALTPFAPPRVRRELPRPDESTASRTLSDAPTLTLPLRGIKLDDEEDQPTNLRPNHVALPIDEEEHPVLRKLLASGAIESLRSDEAAQVVRAKRVAAEAAILKERAVANPPPEPDENDSRLIDRPPGLISLDNPSILIEPKRPKRSKAKRRPLILLVVVLSAALLGLSVGLVIRLLALRGQ
jgi:hypothetical protein